MMLDGTFTVRLTEEKVTRFLEGLIKAVNMTLVWGPYVHQGRKGLHGLAM